MGFGANVAFVGWSMYVCLSMLDIASGVLFFSSDPGVGCWSCGFEFGLGFGWELFYSVGMCWGIAFRGFACLPFFMDVL